MAEFTLKSPSTHSLGLGLGAHVNLENSSAMIKYMLASFNACVWEIGMREWDNGGPIGASNLIQDPEITEFFKSDGSWNTPYGVFFLACTQRCCFTVRGFRGKQRAYSIVLKLTGIMVHGLTRLS